MIRHFLSPTDLTREERESILSRALELKSMREPLPRRGFRVGGLFFNPSLRTRVSWEQAARFLGGEAQTLNAGTDMWKMEMDPSAVMDVDTSECVKEAAGVLGRFYHILGVRSFPQGRPWEEEKVEPVLKAFAEYSGTSVVSLEGAMHHPCQGLADHLTLKEKFGETNRVKAALLWTWHPKSLPMAVPNTFALQSSLAGCELTICHPTGWELDSDLMVQVESEAREAGGSVRVSNTMEEGLAGAQVVYVKAWGSLSQPGIPAPTELRNWTMGEEQYGLTDSAKIMHCLPTRRNVEIASTILDSERSVVIDEAENRLWAQAALIEFLAKSRGVLL